MRTLLSPELRRAEPRLNGLDRLVTRWMNGIMFYLRDDLPLVRGHAIYLDSEWALTSISQRQFWRDVPLPGRRRAVDRHLRMAARRARSPARWPRCCTPQEIRDEVWAQLRAHLDDALDGVEVESWFLDEAIEFPNPRAPRTPSRCW